MTGSCTPSRNRCLLTGLWLFAGCCTSIHSTSSPRIAIVPSGTPTFLQPLHTGKIHMFDGRPASWATLMMCQQPTSEMCDRLYPTCVRVSCQMRTMVSNAPMPETRNRPGFPNCHPGDNSLSNASKISGRNKPTSHWP